MEELAKRILAGDKRAAARLMTMVESDSPLAKKILAELHPMTGRAEIVGITGPPGSGKSTLVDKLALEYRRRGRSVGIIAVDPTSPFTGGALLGDRVRMSDVASDPEVFIRSMGTRGRLGGLARATNDVIKILDAYGKDVIVVETIGAGQSEVDIVKTAHTTVVVDVPGMGDDVQAIKAGILEIGEVFVVNKADREGADRTTLELKAMLDLSESHEPRPPVIKTVATTGEGVTELADAIEEHTAYLKNTGRWSEVVYGITRSEFMEILREDITGYIVEHILGDTTLDDIIHSIANRELDPYSAASNFLDRIRRR